MMAPEHQLDNILNLIKGNLTINKFMETSVTFTESDLHLKIRNEKIDLGGIEKLGIVAIRRILEKLIRDGFISIMEIPKENNLPENLKRERFFYLTFEGYYFSGYAVQSKNNIIENRYKEWTTFALIFGGVAAGIYYTVQLCQMTWSVFHLYYFCH